MSFRATLRGAHEGLVDPRVVVAGDSAGSLERTAERRATLIVGGDVVAGEAATGGQARNDARHQVLLLPVEQARPAARRQVEVVVDGWRFEIELEPEQHAALRDRAMRHRGVAGQSGPAEVHAKIPGVVVSVAVAPGDEVTAGQQLLVVEAMKMQNELRAPRAGTVNRVLVGERSTIEVGDLLVVIE